MATPMKVRGDEAVNVAPALPPSRVHERPGWERSRRQLLVDTTIDLSALIGLEAITVRELCRVAGTAPRTFYNNFVDLRDVFLEGSVQLHEELRRTVLAAYGRGHAPRARAQACVEALVAFVREDPLRADALFVQGHSGGPAVAELRTETMAWLGSLMRGPVAAADRHTGGTTGGSGGHGADRTSAILIEVVLGGVGDVVCSRVKDGDLDGLQELVPALVDTLMRASDGAAAARRSRRREGQEAVA